MLFECKPNIKIFHKKWYGRDDIARGVAYWANYIKTKYDTANPMPLGIAHGVITFSSICAYLALYKIQMPFVCLDGHKLDKDTTPCQGKIVLGESYTNLSSLIDIDCTEYFHHGLAMGQTTRLDDLVFEFAKTHVITSFTSGSTFTKKYVKTSAYQEGLAVQQAIHEYFDAGDVCLFSHDMLHRGVHTTAILPSLFFTERIMFVNAQEWPRMVSEATHCQWFPVMREYFKLTPNIKKITIGGSVVGKDIADHLFSQAPNATIYDIYGLTECLPPLAIRKITSSNQTDEFTICRNDLHFTIVNDQLIITGENQHTQTGDLVDLRGSRFRYIGRYKKLIRINGSLHNQTDIQQMLGKEFDASKFSINISNSILEIQTTDDINKIISWCQQNHVERYNVQLVENIATSGGIKTVNMER